MSKILEGVGIFIDKKYKNKLGKTIMPSEIKDLLNKSSGRMEKKRFYKLGLTKHPDLFKFTDADKALHVPELKEDE